MGRSFVIACGQRTRVGRAVSARGSGVRSAHAGRAGASLVPAHQHVHEQLGICLEGSITFTVGDETRELRRGGTWRIPSEVPHHALAGPDGAVVIDIFSPVRADWAALPRSGPREDRWP